MSIIKKINYLKLILEVSLITLPLFFLISCKEVNITSKITDFQPIEDTSSQFYLRKNTIIANNDTNDIKLSYSCYNNLYDMEKITDITSLYFLNIIDFKNNITIKIKIPKNIEELIKRNKPIIQLCDYKDSIYCFLAQDTLAIWDIINNTTQIKKIKLPNKFNNKNLYLSINLVSHFGYKMICDGEFLYFGSYIMNRNLGWIFDYQDYPYEVKYSLKNEVSTTFNFNYPSFVTENYYGLLFKTYRQKIKTGNIVSFPFSANLYITKNESDSLRVIGGKSKYQKSMNISPLSHISKKDKISSDSDWYYFNHTDYYSQFIYNKNTMQYYRIYYHKLSKLTKNGLYNTHQDKILSIQVFNENFSLIHEEILKDIWFVLHFYPYKNGFIINNNGLKSKSINHEYNYYEVVKK